MKKNTERDFKGVWIDKSIWISKNLSLQEKVFFVEINSLDRDEKGCFAGNVYFSEFFGLSQDRCSEVISSLKKKLYITVDIDKSSGKSKRIIHTIDLDTTRRKHLVGIGENTEWPLGENTAPNNTYINNTINTIPTDAVGGRIINELILLFKGVNETFERLYGRTSERKAVERLLKVYGREKLEDMIKSLPTLNGQKYWPKSTTPIQLENNVAIYQAKKSELETKQAERKIKAVILK